MKYKYYFKLSKIGLESLDLNFFKEFKEHIGEYRIEEEHYQGYIVISFYSDRPLLEGANGEVNIIVRFTDDKVQLTIKYPE